MSQRPPARDRGRWLRLTLAVLPFLGMLVAIPFVNRTEPYVLGLPFLLFWIVVWVVLTAVCMTVVYRSDPANRPGTQDEVPAADAHHGVTR